MEWFFRLAAKRRPDVKLHHLMAWTILRIPFLRARVYVLLKSRQDPPIRGMQALWRVLSGTLSVSRRVSANYVKATHEYTLDDIDGRWATSLAEPGDDVLLQRDAFYRYALQEPKGYVDSFIMLPWMSIEEKKSYMDLDEAPVWILSVEWGFNIKEAP